MEAVELADYRRPDEWAAGSAVVDTDVQINPPSLSALFPYLEDRWRDYILESGMGELESNLYP